MAETDLDFDELIDELDQVNKKLEELCPQEY